MYLVAMLISLSWPNPGPVMFLDNYPLSLVTSTATTRLDGFKDMATCLAYTPQIPNPTLNGSIPIVLTITKKSCVKYKIGTPADKMPGEPGAP